MVQENIDLEGILRCASEREMDFDWPSALECYDDAMGLMSNDDPLRRARLLEMRAHALHKYAFTSDGRSEFEKRIANAVESYLEAKSALEDIKEPEASASAARCSGMVSFLRYWIADDVSERKQLAFTAWEQGKAALRALEGSGEAREYASTFNTLVYSVAFIYNHSDDVESKRTVLREALGFAEHIVKRLGVSGDKEQLAKAHAKAAAILVAIERDFADLAEKDKIDLEALSHLLKGMEGSEASALLDMPFFVILQNWPSATKTEQRADLYRKGRVAAERVKDRFILGCVLDGLAQRQIAASYSADDAVDKERLMNEGFQLAKEAKENLRKVGFVSPNVSVVWIEVPAAGYYAQLADVEKNPAGKRALLDKARKPCVEQLELAKKSGYPDIVAAANFMLGHVSKELGKILADPEEKKPHLHQAIELLGEAYQDDLRIHPNQYFLQGNDVGELADAQYELAMVTGDPASRKVLMKDAITRGLESAALCEKDVLATPDASSDIRAEMSHTYRTVGTRAKKLHEMSGELDCLKRAGDSFDRAVYWSSEAGLTSETAENLWEAARISDALGDFQKASERFGRAAQEYRKAAESIPRLKDFYGDHALYMEAWGQIEQAKHYHKRQEPELAEECYKNASEIHRSTRRWNYLATNYSAWAKVEHAEGLSRKEAFQEAIAAFEGASKLFQESKDSLVHRVAGIEDPDEKNLARRLQIAADIRRAYCEARMRLEQARSDEKRGDLHTAADEYASAVDAFERILKTVETEDDRRDCRLIVSLAKAWEAMSRAEAESSPELYLEASKLFEEAKDLSLGEKGKLLALGHSRFCKALELGSRFSDSGDLALHTLVNQHLDNAANYYTKAGVAAASEYAKASKLLFEGYVNLMKANKEEDQRSKAKLYVVAERLLEASVSSLQKAEQPRKLEQVTGLLSRVREEKQLAISLTEVLKAPDILSSTIAFTTPTPSYEKAIGVEGLEHANIQALLTASRKEMRVGEDLDLEIELTNAGKFPAELKRVDGIVPPGFELSKKPDKCRADGQGLVVKDKRIDPMCTHDLTCVVRATSKGEFLIKPRVVYLDETGTSRSGETDAIQVVVKELGISGWLRGPGKKHDAAERPG